jgi:membrane glycosyltransferase
MIYDIPERYRAIMSMSSEDEGMAEAISNAIDELMSEQADGAEIAAKMIAEMRAINDALSAEIDKLKTLKARRENRCESLRECVRKSMIATGINSIETSVGTFKLRAGSERTVVNDETALVDLATSDERFSECIKCEVITKPVLASIKHLIKSGLIPDAVASIVRGEPTISIK